MKLGFVGLGHMGGPIARVLAQAGHDLTVFDLDRGAATDVLGHGATWADSGEAAASGADAVLLCLPGPTQVEAAIFGADGVVQGCADGAAIIDLSTNSPEVVRRMEERLRERGVHLIDAPVSGGPRGARRGTLTVMVGASPEQFERFRPVFEALGEKIFYAGGIGNGSVAKLVNNQLCFIGVLAMTEALVAGTKAGLDPMVLREIVQASSGGSFVWTGGTMAILQDRLQPTFTTTLACKDLRLASELAQGVAASVPLLERALELMEHHRDAGFAEEDMMATVRALEDAAGWQVRGTWHE